MTTESDKLGELLALFDKNVIKKQVRPVKKKAAPKPRKPLATNGEGYKYSRDKQGRLRSHARILMEEKIGGPIPDHMTVGYIDGNKNNCVIENLYLGFKQGVPLNFLHCKHCGQRGSIVVGPDNAPGGPTP